MKIFFEDIMILLETLRYLKYEYLVGDLKILFKNLEILLKTWRQAKSSCLEHLLTRKAPFLLLFNNNH